MDPNNPIVPDNQNGNGAPAGKPGEVVSKEQFDNLLAELKDLRTKREGQGESTVDVDKKIADALSAKEKEESGKNWDKALESFLKTHKEFHPDNDPSGIKKAALDRELKVLNRDGLTSVEELTSLLDKARILVTANIAPVVDPVHLDPSLPRNDNAPVGSDVNKLSPKELRVIEQIGWTPERYLKLKAKDPVFVEKMITQAP